MTGRGCLAPELRGERGGRCAVRANGILLDEMDEDEEEIEDEEEDEEDQEERDEEEEEEGGWEVRGTSPLGRVSTGRGDWI